MIINEKKLIDIISSSKNILLLEPQYTRSYAPLGLAKISAFIKQKGGKVTFARNPIPGNFDLICMTSLFTWDSQKVLRAIKNCRGSFFTKNVPIILGGIFATLMSEYVLQNVSGVFIFKGVSEILDSVVPDYSIDWRTKGYFTQAMSLFTTRGCKNKCPYCVVWRNEGSKIKIKNVWRDSLKQISKPIVFVSDNNFLSAPAEHVSEVISEINKNHKKVIFDSGLDCSLIDKNNARLLKTLRYEKRGLRFAFDEMSQNGIYQKSMEILIDAGVQIGKDKSYTFILYNFNDTPQEALYRSQTAWKYGSSPYFMRYRPLNLLVDDDFNFFVGKYWTKNLAKAFAIFGQTFGYEKSTFEEWSKKLFQYTKIRLTSEDWEYFYFKRK